ncbi:hypothetical protein OO007_17025 [Cocleimonas sp. KMM 6892]|uniref:hypothetical protein n=1 Tax=unclassified Cocleimonas TaxID=2639732 RepID=UPI002DB75B2E|nr:MULTISPECIES: hypothetical protein [unclassified Cocleimonas]MEB8433944.1 hypothetical protein [Cocleimonas sp. KMM 6892]MEC4716755.1 hypothetical protein [Cocleimonas sp. KMM 6895]MEC4746090.1 hypothetical protein [Cocleimonas sp. KMM 6896]
MKNLAIHQALRLDKYPEEMAWLCFPDSELPEGTTELLRLCTSKKQLEEFANVHNLESDELHHALLNFVEKAMVIDGNSDEKILGTKLVNSTFTNRNQSEETLKLHYQLLMKIFHPDVNSDPKATHFSTLVTNAYTNLKQKRSDQEELITVSEYRKPPKSFYNATQKTEMQISNTRSAMAVLSAITIFTLVAMVGHFYDPANPELITTNIENPIQDPESIGQTNPIRKAAINTAIEVSDSNLQSMLRKLESAYEDGRVDIIKPILANTPEIKNQTDQQLTDKLETLFEITSERKMVLFDFDWKNTSGEVQGKGKFLSRYHLKGEERWLTREGIATITLLKDGNKLSINQLELENSSIEQ